MEKARWSEADGRLRLTAEAGTLFDDGLQHWNDGVLRLMGWDERTGRAFAEAVIDRAGGPELWMRAGTAARSEALVQAGQALFPEPKESSHWDLRALEDLSALGRPLETLWTRALAGDAAWAVAGSRQPAHGVLLSRHGGKAAPAEAPEYEEAYFEGGLQGYGYGQLEAQAWRMEKARRQAGQLDGLLRFHGALPGDRAPRLLDVGSGYGHLRQAAAGLGWKHAGVELSRHAADAAKKAFNFGTQHGVLADHAEGGYDLITMMDLVEHVADPVDLLLQARERLVPGGLCVIRTPNLLALEREVFGHRYHSFKAEHLHSFSVGSLSQVLLKAGLAPVHASTEAHLFKGFLGADNQLLARELRGSDILAAGQKAAA
jgi:SAM-dependent methyltransferase